MSDKLDKALLSSSPKLAPGFRMQFEPAQQGYVLLYPEGMVQLNDPATEILSRCDGATRLDRIVRDLELSFEEDDLSADVLEFVQTARDQGWLDCES